MIVQRTVPQVSYIPHTTLWDVIDVESTPSPWKPGFPHFRECFLSNEKIKLNFSFQDQGRSQILSSRVAVTLFCCTSRESTVLQGDHTSLVQLIDSSGCEKTIFIWHSESPLKSKRIFKRQGDRRDLSPIVSPTNNWTQSQFRSNFWNPLLGNPAYQTIPNRTIYR
jgi:hypothetical protein